MKKLTLLSLILTILISVPSCGQSKTKKNMESKKVLVAYFSATGTTKAVAERIAAITGGETYEIVPTKAYTSDDLNWRDSTSRSSLEMKNPDSRTAIQPVKIDFSKYDYVFIGYPIWWDLAPRAINTFIESCNFTNQTLIPFATSGSSTIDNSEEQLKVLYPNLTWGNGKLLNGLNDTQIKEWTDSVIKQ